MKISACTVIKNAMNGYCLFEAMASILPFVDDMVVLDMGSTDGTWEYLIDIASKNPKIHVYKREYPWVSATELADAQTSIVKTCRNDRILFFQADEIWHEGLLCLLPEILENEKSLDIAFWRVQLKENFQTMKWVPHIVHRIGTKESMVFKGNSMNPVNIGTYDLSVYPIDLYFDRVQWSKERWEELDPFDFDFSVFILDISKNGAFLDNIGDKSKEHAPLWNEEPNIDGVPIDEWKKNQVTNVLWFLESTRFEIPHILKYHVGKTKYEVRPDLIKALKSGHTKAFLGL